MLSDTIEAEFTCKNCSCVYKYKPEKCLNRECKSVEFLFKKKKAKVVKSKVYSHFTRSERTKE